MMNEILRDLINEGKVAAFVDEMLVGTETEKGHNEIVEEILKRLEENDLYVKPEKCIWKVRKIGFLRVVIGPNGIEIEKKKVDGVLSWPEPKNVKNVRKFLCHDLAKQLSQYLYFFSFSFLFFWIITKVEHGKYHVTVTESQKM